MRKREQKMHQGINIVTLIEHQSQWCTLTTNIPDLPEDKFPSGNFGIKVRNKEKERRKEERFVGEVEEGETQKDLKR